MAKAYNNSKTEMSTKAFTRTGDRMVMENTTGKTVQFTRATLPKDCVKERVFGRV
jgi:hypothetical protein